MQVIFGAGGPIGRQLSKELKKYTDSVRLVSRKAKKTLPECIAFQADLAKKNDAIEAAKGCEIVYLTAGLEYKTKVWKELWPLIMSNTIEACKLNDAALVFFDNIYMYDKNHINGMNENTPVNPSSEKGKVRALIGKMMMDEVSKGNLKGIIVRSADFISPNNSLLTEMIFNNLKKNKNAMWFMDIDKVHNFTFYKDAAAGTAILGNTKDAYGEIWHLPTDPSKLTVRQWIEMFAKELGTEPKVTVVKKSMMHMLGWFVPVIREFKEMAYQYDRDYFFDSSKFNKKFDYKPATPKEAVKHIVSNFK